MQSDPIGLGGGINTYLYAYANPTKYIDPNGLAGWDSPEAWGAAPSPSLSGGIWTGFGPTVNAHMIIAGGSQTIQSLTNILTGETCAVSVTCGRIGPGILVEGGVAYNGSINGPQCGKDLDGLSFQISGALVSPAGGGTGDVGIGDGGSLGAGSSLGSGAGFYVGVGVCKLEVIGECMFTPEECKDGNCEK
jgi:hypothetical protein